MSDEAMGGGLRPGRRAVGGAERGAGRGARRRAVLAVILVVAVVIGITVIATRPTGSGSAADGASEPPIAADGTSVLTSAGIERVLRDGRLSISLRPGRLRAGELGLPDTGATPIALPVPVTLTVLGSDDAIVWEHVDDVEVVTRNGRIDEVGIALPQGSERQRIDELSAQFGWPSDTGKMFSDEITQSERDPFLYTRVVGLLRVSGLWAHLLAKGGGDQTAVVRLVLAAEEGPTL